MPPKASRERLCLTTTEIRFLLPESPPFVLRVELQTHDVHPGYPALKRFLDDCSTVIVGELLTVRVLHREPIRSGLFRTILGRFSILQEDPSDRMH